MTSGHLLAALEAVGSIALKGSTMCTDKRRQQLPPKGRSQRLNLLVGGFLELSLSYRDREGAVLVLERQGPRALIWGLLPRGHS